MIIAVIFFSILFSQLSDDDENGPPGFHRVSRQNGDLTYTPVSTAMAPGSHVLHNGQDITAWDFRNTTTPSKQISTVLNQTGCSACWAFSSSDVAGAAMFFNSLESSEKINTVMSPQYMVNCATLSKSQGTVFERRYDCDGSTIPAMEDIMEFGTVENDCIPYEKKRNECLEKCTNTSVRFRKFVDKTFDVHRANHVTDLAFLRRLVVTSGPVGAQLDWYSDANKYKGGVYEHDRSQETHKQHAIAIYGFGVEDGKNYWLVKNSYGPNWGVNGFMKIRMGTNESGIENVFRVINNNFNSSRPRPGVRMPSSMPKPAPGWNCSTADPNCSSISTNYIVDGSSYVPPPPPSDKNFSVPKNNRTATHYYVSTNGEGDCLSRTKACNLSAAMKIATTNRVLHVGAGTYVAGNFSVDEDNYLSFVGNGTGKTQMGTKHTYGDNHSPTGGVTYRFYLSWRLYGDGGSGSGLYFSKMTLVNRAESIKSTRVEPKYLVMFLVCGANAVLTCTSVNFVCEEDNKGLIVSLIRGQVYITDCTMSQWVSNATHSGIFVAHNTGLYPTFPNVLFFQNVSVTNLTTGSPVISEWSGGSTPLQVLISKCVFENISTTNDPALSLVNTTDQRAFRNQSVVYSANYKNKDRTVGIHNSRFININGASGAFSAGGLFFNLNRSSQDWSPPAHRPNITDCYFEKCVGRAGGAVFVMEGVQYFLRCNFVNNTRTGSFPYGASDVSIKNNHTDSKYGFAYFAASCSLSTEPRIRSERRGDLSRFLATCVNDSDGGGNKPKASSDGGIDDGNSSSEGVGWKNFVFIVVGAFLGVALIAIAIVVVVLLKKRKRDSTGTTILLEDV